MAKITTSSENIGLREFRENTSKYISALKKGKKFTVFRHSKPVFAVVPAEELECDLDEIDGRGWTDFDLTKVRKGGVPAGELLAALRSLHEQGK